MGATELHSVRDWRQNEEEKCAVKELEFMGFILFFNKVTIFDYFSSAGLFIKLSTGAGELIKNKAREGKLLWERAGGGRRVGGAVDRS